MDFSCKTVGRQKTDQESERNMHFSLRKVVQMQDENSKIHRIVKKGLEIKKEVIYNSLD